MSEVIEDRISNLPTSLVHHILSFVDTRDAAQTGVLSKRWKNIWRSIPALEFECKSSSQANKFMDFVDSTLEFHDESNIKKFTLLADIQLNSSRVKNWISTVISHNVEELRLVLDREDIDLIPASLYTCESLTILALLASPDICFPLSFPRLNKCVLGRAEFRDEQLFSNCPKLELLILGHCFWSDMKNFCISNAALKILSIFNAVYQDGFRNCALNIHAPNLEEFAYIGRVAKDYVLSSFPALVEARVHFVVEEYGTMSVQDMDDYGTAVSKFLRAVAHAECLNISNATLQVIFVVDSLFNNIPSFHNLNRLCLEDKVTADRALIALLEKAPNLVSLEFEKVVPPSAGEEEDSDDNAGEDNHNNDAAEGEDNNENENNGWALDMVDTRCSFSHLRFVRFNRFTGNAREMRWLKLFLKNAKALEAITISCDPISQGISKKVMADISSLPRASTSCVFKLLL